MTLIEKEEGPIYNDSTCLHVACLWWRGRGSGGERGVIVLVYALLVSGREGGGLWWIGGGGDFTTFPSLSQLEDGSNKNKIISYSFSPANYTFQIISR